MKLFFLAVVGLTLAKDEDILNTGKFEAFPRNSRFTVSAPHGTFDRGTDSIARVVGEKLGWNSLIVTGFRSEFRPINVNRPTEGVHIKADEEKHTERAAKVYSVFKETLAKVTPSPPSLYVEIHGQKELSHVDIAVVGIDAAKAEKIKMLVKASLAKQGLSQIDVKIEGVDRIQYSATSTKKFGILGIYPTALHIELPRELRDKKLEPLTAALVDSLSEVQKLI